MEHYAGFGRVAERGFDLRCRRGWQDRRAWDVSERIRTASQVWLSQAIADAGPDRA